MNVEARKKMHAIWLPEEAHNILKHRKQVSGIPISRQIVSWIYGLPEGKKGIAPSVSVEQGVVNG